MNKVYKVVFNKSTGQWSAVSELARGKTKSKNIRRLLTASIVGALFSTLSTVGWAVCTGLGSDSVYCDGTDSGPLDSAAAVMRAPVTVTAENWTLDVGRLHVTNIGGSTITFNGTNVTITNGVSATPGLIHIASSLAGDAIISIENSNITGTTGAYGLVTYATGTGNASTTASDSTFTMNDGEALHAITNSSTGGNATVTSVANTITVNGGGTHDGITATALNGTATINLTGANNITMNNGGSALAANGENVSVSVTGSSAVLKTTQASGHGIKATASTGTSTVTTAGTITTSGEAANGINSITTTGANTITNNATINTSGDKSNSINATSTTGKITVTNNAEVSTSGTSSHGILAVAKYGDVNITNIGKIKTTKISSHGINSTVSGSGSGEVINTGEITVDLGYGILSSVYDGNMVITNSGTVTTAGTLCGRRQSTTGLPVGE